MKTTLKFFVLVALFLPGRNLTAQFIQHYTTANTSTTLCNNWINTIVEDSSGIKWFGTGYGVSRFDGANWTTYTEEDGLLDNMINAKSIAIDTLGNVWFGTNKGLSKFDGTNFTNYTDVNPVNCVTVDSSNNIWVGTYDSSDEYRSVFKYDGTSWTSYTIPGFNRSSVRDITIDRTGTVWVGDWDGLSKFDGIKLIDCPQNTPDSKLRIDDARGVYADFENNIWIGDDNYIWKKSDTNWTVYPTQITHDMKYAYIHTIAGDREENIWAASYHNGVSKFDGSSWSVLNKEGNFPIGQCYAILVDNQGSKWFGTQKGISILNNNSWSYFRGNGLLHNTVNSIIEDSKGLKWFGTSNGISVFNGINWQNEMDTVEGVRNFAYDKSKNIWVAASNGVFKYDGATWTHYNSENSQLIKDNVGGLTIDKNDNKWIATSKGASKFNDTTWINYAPDSSDSYLIQNPKSIEIDRHNNKWIFAGSRAFKFDGAQWSYYRTVDNSNPKDMAIDTTGNIWLCTASGLYKSDSDNWLKYDIQETFKSIAVDAKNNAWAETEESILRFDGAQWYKYQINNNFISDRGDMRCILNDSNNIWIGTQNGITRMDSAYVIDSASSLEPVLTDTLFEVYFSIKESSNFIEIYSNRNTISESIIPLKEGHILSALYKEEEYVNKWNFNTDVVTGPDTLYAEWIINKYTVKFTGTIGTPIRDTVVNYNTLITAPPEPIRSGHTFVGWYIGQSYLSEWNFDTDVVKHNLNLHAKWIPNKYVVSFYDDEGMVLPDTLVTYGTLVSNPPEPTKNGRVFLNWYKDPEHTILWNFKNDMVLENTILYAKWLIVSNALNEKLISNVNFFPNPAESILHLENLPKNSKIYIYSTEGKLIIQSKLKEPDGILNIQQLPKGSYILRVSSKEGEFQDIFIKE